MNQTTGNRDQRLVIETNTALTSTREGGGGVSNGGGAGMMERRLLTGNDEVAVKVKVLGRAEK